MNTTPDNQTPNPGFTAGDEKLPVVFLPDIKYVFDITSIFGIILSLLLISFAISMGNSNASFFDLPSVLIVILGTFTATSIAFTLHDIVQSGQSIYNAFINPKRDFPLIVRALMDLANVARKRGVLALSNYETQIKKEPFLSKSLQFVIDGFNPSDIERILRNEIEADMERNKRASTILKKAAEIAPTMGLVGTLIGLVQMLADLENPETIGPAMALALLTTFYGAILGSVILSPLSTKLEKIAAEHTLLQVLSLKTALSILRQENPRNLEHMLNSELPPSQRIVYFD